MKELNIEFYNLLLQFRAYSDPIAITGEEGVELVKKIKVWFNEAQFNVRKFRPNSEELRTYFETLENVNIVNNTVYKEIVDSKINHERLKKSN